MARGLPSIINRSGTWAVTGGLEGWKRQRNAIGASVRACPFQKTFNGFNWKIFIRRSPISQIVAGASVCCHDRNLKNNSASYEPRYCRQFIVPPKSEPPATPHALAEIIFGLVCSTRRRAKRFFSRIASGTEVKLARVAPPVYTSYTKLIVARHHQKWRQWRECSYGTNADLAPRWMASP